MGGLSEYRFTPLDCLFFRFPPYLHRQAFTAAVPMKVYFILLCCLAAPASFAQCFSIKEMRVIARKGVNERKAFMKAQGFAYVDSARNGPRHWQWRQPKQPKYSATGFDAFVDASDKTGRRIIVYNRIKSTPACVQQFRTELAALNMQKAAEFRQGDKLVSYYFSPEYQIRLMRYTYNGKYYLDYKLFATVDSYKRYLRSEYPGK